MGWLFGSACVAKCSSVNVFARPCLPVNKLGYTNAAVALERLGKTQKAKTVYKAAIAHFPDNDKPLSSLVNILQVLPIVVATRWW